MPSTQQVCWHKPGRGGTGTSREQLQLPQYGLSPSTDFCCTPDGPVDLVFGSIPWMNSEHASRVADLNTPCGVDRPWTDGSASLAAFGFRSNDPLRILGGLQVALDQENEKVAGAALHRCRRKELSVFSEAEKNAHHRDTWGWTDPTRHEEAGLFWVT